MLFKKKPKPPLEEAISLVLQAVDIAYEYKRDKRYQPTEKDLMWFEWFRETLWTNHHTAEYISRCMQQRFRGEKEGSPKWHNDKVFDYHYPP